MMRARARVFRRFVEKSSSIHANLEPRDVRARTAGKSRPVFAPTSKPTTRARVSCTKSLNDAPPSKQRVAGSNPAGITRNIRRHSQGSDRFPIAHETSGSIGAHRHHLGKHFPFNFYRLGELQLITGERGGISEETNAAFRASGLFHVYCRSQVCTW